MRPIGSSTSSSSTVRSDSVRRAREAVAALGAEGPAREVGAADAGLAAVRQRDERARARSGSPRAVSTLGSSPDTSSADDRAEVAAAPVRPQCASALRPGSATRKTRSPSRRRGARRRSSRSRTVATEPAASQLTRPSAARVAGPQTPSAVAPALRWNWRERGLGLGAEDAVLAAGVEAERVQPALELGDVVAAQHRARQVEQPVAELEAALDQRAPGLGSADAVDAQPASLLELADRGFEACRRTRRRPRRATPAAAPSAC